MTRNGGEAAFLRKAPPSAPSRKADGRVLDRIEFWRGVLGAAPVCVLGAGGASADAENFASAEARRGTEPVWQLSDRPRHPFGLPLIDWYCTQALEGRGGSVSRRDHSQATRNRAHAAWAHKPEETHKPIPSYSSGEGVWGRGASLREAASPPEFPPVYLLQK